MYERVYNTFFQQQKYDFKPTQPFGYRSFSKSNEPLHESFVSHIAQHYRKRLSSEWTPITVTKTDPPIVFNPAEIYPKHFGMLPKYAGHIPGAKFRSGVTYGTDTVDAKRWLRNDFSPL